MKSLRIQQSSVYQIAKQFYRRRFAKHSDTHKGSYQQWLERHDAICASDLQAARKDSNSLASRPLISIVMRDCAKSKTSLRRTIDSLLNQAYPFWELRLTCATAAKQQLDETLAHYRIDDNRVKVVNCLDESGSIYSSLAVARGEWVALLSTGDELAPHALYLIAKAINEAPHSALFYADEDKIDETGQRFSPYFKPDWNPDLFHSQNLISHTGIYRASLARKLGPSKDEYAECADYDFTLRYVEATPPEQIVHIPRVLYHKYAAKDSTASMVAIGFKAALIEKQTLEDHFSHIKSQQIAAHIAEDGRRVQHALPPGKQPKISLIVPTRDCVDLVRKCVGSILQKTNYSNYEILLVDNQSTRQATFEYFDELRTKEPRVRILPYNHPFNYSAINNWAAASSDADLIGLINNDIEVITGEWLQEMASHAMREDIGAVGAMLYYPNDTIQHAGIALGVGGIAAHIYSGMPRGSVGQMGRLKVVQNLSAVTAACLLVRRSTFEAVGGLDPRLKVAFNDVDFCLRVRALGLRNLWTPYAELYHHESASRGHETTLSKRWRLMRESIYMMRRWGMQLHKDPAYNPNLTLDDRDFSLSNTPRLASFRSIIADGASVFFDL